MALSQPLDTAIAASVTASGASSADEDIFVLSVDTNDLISGGATTLASEDSDGIDTMTGGSGDDTYIVKDTGDVIVEYAGDGNDTVWSTVDYTLSANVENIAAAGTANTTLTGNALANILDGTFSASVNTLKGLAGDDQYYLGLGDLVVEAAGGGTDTIFSDFGVNLSAASAVNVENFTLTSSDGATINGNALANVLKGNTGTDTISGGLGDDILDTGAGGNDVLNGGAGNDTYIIRSSSSTVSITDSAGTDTVKSVADVDVSATTAGVENVTLLGSSAIDATGNSLNNVLTGNSAINVLTGNAGNDTLDGKAGSDTLDGGAGNDTLKGGTGTNELTGGAGNDTYVVVSGTDIITEDAATTGGTDVIQYGGGVDEEGKTLNMGLGVETLTMSGTFDLEAAGNALKNTMTGNDGDNALDGAAGDDTINGGAGDDTLDGGDGKDTLDGGDGEDTINGGEGDDTLKGGAAGAVASAKNTMDGGNGNDTYVVVDADDNITEATTGGTDLVQYNGTDEADTFVMDANVENLIMGGTADINATGNASNNVMTGNAGDNTLKGGAGNDTIDGKAGADEMVGGNGNDIYTVDNVGDTVDETTGTTGNSGADEVKSSVDFTLTSKVEKLTLTGTAAIDGTGSDDNNTITGNAAANSIGGAAGNDILNAGAGADTIDGGDGNDTITGGTGRDVVTTGLGSDTVVFAAGTADTVATTTALTSTDGIDLYDDLVLDNDTGDKIDLSNVTVASVGDAVTGAVNKATFIANMNTALSAAGVGFKSTAGGIDAAVVNVNGGDLDGNKYLVVDLNGSDTFTNVDFVIEITGSTVTDLSSLTFV